MPLWRMVSLLSLDMSVETEKTTKEIRKGNTRLKNFFYLMAEMVYFGEFRKKYRCIETG